MIFHEVDDVDHWLSSPKREELFGLKFDGVRPETILTLTESEGPDPRPGFRRLSGRPHT